MKQSNLAKQLLQDDLFNAADKFKLLKDISEAEDFQRLSILVAMRANKNEWGDLTRVANDLVRCAGLFPYLEQDSHMSLSSRMAKTYYGSSSRAKSLHRDQQAVLKMLLDGDSVILSAPTSFGKTFIVEELLLSNQYNNVMMIVPTIALIEEIRRKAKKLDLPHERISFRNQNFSNKNFFILTQERAYGMFEKIKEDIKQLDLLIIDEFYKVDSSLSKRKNKDHDRAAALTLVYRKYSSITKQFYLLGPYLNNVNGFDTRYHKPRFLHYKTNTTYQEFIDANNIEGDDKQKKVSKIILKEKESVLVYCSSPDAIRTLFNENFKNILSATEENDDLIKWISQNIASNWYLIKALKMGIGIHHGRLPKFLTQEAIRRFENGKIKVLLCTSTIIEGVNTNAKAVVIYSNKQSFRDGQLAFRNIAGRAGRMFKHFSGRIYHFDYPRGENNLVDINDPIGSDKEGETVGLLNLVEGDYSFNKQQQKKVEEYKKSTSIPTEVLAKNYYIDLDLQNKVVGTLQTTSVEKFNEIKGAYLSSEQMIMIFELIEELGLNMRHYAPASSMNNSHIRAAIFIDVYFREGLRGLIRSSNKDKIINDESIEAAFSFIKNAMSYNIPKYIRALDRLIIHVYGNKYTGLLKFFADRLEFLNTNKVYIQLEELGIPIDFSQKYKVKYGNLKEAAQHIKSLRPKLHSFDKYIADKFLESF